MRLRKLLPLTALLLAACEEPPVYYPPVEPADLFSPDYLAEYHLELSPDAIDSLDRDPRKFVRGTLRFRDEVYRNVGVRLKGGVGGTFRELDEKAGFRVKLDVFEPGQLFYGLESITLNNLLQDPSGTHEWLGYQLFRAVGVPAPRVGFARVFVNDYCYGLYAHIEAPDDPFLQSVYDDPSGNLYEGEYGTDLRPDDVDAFEQDEGSDRSRDDLRAFIARVEAGGAELFYGDEAVVDLERTLGFLAGEAVLGHWDGYYQSHNYRIYHEPAPDTWSFIPWGIDQTFVQAVDPFASEGVLAQRCFEVPACFADFVDRTTLALDAFVDLGLDDAMADIEAIVDEGFADDPRREYDLARIAEARAWTRRWIRQREQALRPRLGCLDDDGVPRDDDGDGYDACTRDCDDGDDAVHPGAQEACDGIDNNCDGAIDDRATCDCLTDGELVLCTFPRTWEDAREVCEELDLDLAWPADADDNVDLWERMQRTNRTQWYLGATDADDEGEWESVTGEELEFLPWAQNEPNNQGGNEHCATLVDDTDARWNDVGCDNPFPFACR